MPTIKPKREFDPNSELRIPDSLRKAVNKDFIIQVKYKSGETRLRGAGRLYKELGHTTAKNVFKRILHKYPNQYTETFRSGLKINFFMK